MKIKIQTSDELNSLLDVLAREIVDAQIYHRLFCDLIDSISDHEREFQQSNTFWSLTIDSLKEARLTQLCRVFDQECSSLNLVNLLDKSFSIFNRYSSLYRASTWSRQIIGHDNYKSLLEFLRLGLQKWDEDSETELAEIRERKAEHAGAQAGNPLTLLPRL